MREPLPVLVFGCLFALMLVLFVCDCCNCLLWGAVATTTSSTLCCWFKLVFLIGRFCIVFHKSLFHGRLHLLLKNPSENIKKPRKHSVNSSKKVQANRFQHPIINRKKPKNVTGFFLYVQHPSTVNWQNKHQHKQPITNRIFDLL